ncbi:MAG: hypothetical protein LUF26_02360 [Firmicutes bacterium]|nr:hypothetical protein [Bacillota bacterium]
MSVIFGIDEPGKIYICGDRRGSTAEGKLINDNLQKVIEIHPSLAFASAGNAAIELAIKKEIEKSNNRNELTTNGLIDIIENFYNRVRAVNEAFILNLPYYCLIAGKATDGAGALISLACKQGNLSYKSVPMALYHPADADQKQCNLIFARNYKSNYKDFCENTVREISEISYVVSPTGDKWIFDKTTGTGTLYTF